MKFNNSKFIKISSSSLSLCRISLSIFSLIMIMMILLSSSQPISSAQYHQQQANNNNDDDIHKNLINNKNNNNVQSFQVLRNIFHKNNSLSSNSELNDDNNYDNDIPNKPISYQNFVESMDVNKSKQSNELRAYPQTLHLNVDEVGKFKIYMTQKLAPDQIVYVNLRCSLQKCSTFENTFEPVVLNVNRSSVEVNFTARMAGHDDIDLVIDFKQSTNIDKIKADNGYIMLRVGHSNFLTILGMVFGWLYFVCWSVSFWPQNISNYKRKSVVGLSFDYTILHFTGFLFYVTFNIGLYGFPVVQELYEQKYPRSEIPVELNDVVYAAHAAMATSITWGQCFIYERGTQRVSIYGRLFQCAIWSVGSLLLVLAIMNVVNWLNFIYYFSYVKLVITALKYLPQVYFNYLRKSTAGWSIYMIYLDILGGSTSLMQMLINAFNYNDWTTLIGNLPKLGLSIASISYDIVFLLQEFVFYPPPKKTANSVKQHPLDYESDTSSQISGGHGLYSEENDIGKLGKVSDIRRLSSKLASKLINASSISDSQDKLCPSTTTGSSNNGSSSHSSSSHSSTPTSSIGYCDTKDNKQRPTINQIQPN